MAFDDPKNLNDVLDQIHDLALKAAGVEGIPREVDEALDKIVALARYKFNVVPTADKKS